MRLKASLRGAVKRIPGMRALAARLRDPDLAALRRSMRDGRLAVLQPYTTTSTDRYPALFDRVAALIGEAGDSRVLSFGCSGGEEVRALRRRLPEAWLVGVDVNPRAIARAQRRDPGSRSRYLVGDRPPHGARFAAIAALAVFRHGTLGSERPLRCTDVLPFAQAANVFASLDAALDPGGLMIWGNAHFRLSDMPGGESYELVETSADLSAAEVLYGPDDYRLDGLTDSGGIYRKR